MLSDEYTYEYLDRRGISKATHQHFGVLTKIDKEGKPIAVGYKYPDGWHKVRKLDAKEFYIEGQSRPGLFGRDKFVAGCHQSVIVTEGEDDALSIWEVLKVPVVSVQSSSSAKRDCAADLGWLNSFERVYFALDNDTPGRAALRECAPLLDPNKTYVLDFSTRKDANDFLVAGEADELRNIYANAKKYLPAQITSSLAEFKKILETPRRVGVPYPFPKLDEMLYGIRTSECVLVTAPTGVGKTEFLHALEYQLLKETDHAVAAIYLEEPEDDHLRALAGYHLQRPTHLPDGGVTNSEQFAAISDLLKVDDRLYLYRYFGGDDPEILLDLIRFLVVARGVRYVLFDHISMAVSGIAGTEDERRALDKLSTRLEVMVKELDFSLVVVSHVNDDGKTRGSRLIAGNCDIRIDLQRDVLNPDPMISSQVHLSVHKNRPMKKTGPAGVYVFDIDKYRYVQEGEPWLPSISSQALSTDLSTTTMPSVTKETLTA
jgi:twinkle protein